jgi:citrate lyase gamma subunit
VLPGFAARSALQKDSVTTSSTEQSALDALIQARVDAYLDRAGR